MVSAARKSPKRRRRSGPRSVRRYQFGAGPTRMALFKAQPLQRGYGFGGLFRGLLKSIAPMAKRGLLSVGKAALNAGARALEDVRDNKTSMKQALRKQAVETFNPLTAINRAVRKRKASTQPRQTKRKVPRVSIASSTPASRRTKKRNRTNKGKKKTTKAPFSDVPSLKGR